MAKCIGTKVVTNKVRFSFVNLFEPKAFGDSGDAKYSVMLLIPKSDADTVGKCREAIKAATEKGKATKFGGKVPPVLKTTFKDADVDTDQDGETLVNKYPETAGHYVINVSSRTKPQVVDRRGMVIEDPSIVYSGCYGRASINFYAYNFNGNKGISAGLGNVQFLEDGAPLGSECPADVEFADTIDDALDDIKA